MTHAGQPNFRVGRKTFASIEGPDGSTAVVRLTSEQQAMFVANAPGVFAPVPGGFGQLGSTDVRLAVVDDATVESALGTAWRNIATAETR